MLCSKINFHNDLSYYQKRQLDSSGKRNVRVKRIKIVNDSNFDHLPNEIYREVFDYLCPLNIIQSFYGLNHRLDRLITNLPMKFNFQNLNKIQYKRILKQILPKLIEQIVSIEFGPSSCFSSLFNSEARIDLFLQSFHFTQFSNLRCLSLTSPSLNQLESLLSLLPKLSSLRSLYLLEEDFPGSQNETVCKLTLANHSPIKTNHLSHLFIQTSPPFKTLILLYKHLINKISLDYLQINIRCALFFYPDCLTHLNYDGLSRLITNMNSFKIDMICGTYKPAFDLIQLFPKIEYLSIKTNSQAYANGYQWAELLAQLSNLIKIDLNIELDSEKFDQEYPTFQTKFWFEQKWFVHYRKTPWKCQLIHRSIKVR